MTVGETGEAERRPRRTVIAIAGLCLLLYGAALPLPSVWRGDERYYTDSALKMREVGDLLTPRWADGSPRFNKPVLPYWMVLGGHALFGVNLWSSRLPFLLAGVTLLWVAFALGRSMGGTDDAGLVAVAMLAANTQFFNLTVRATPDIVVSLCLATSLWGFGEMLLHHRFGPLRGLAAFGGAALAMAGKGLWGLGPPVLAAVWMLARRDRPRWGQVFDLRWVLTALVMGGAWYIAMWTRHGPAALAGFFEDQIGSRFTGVATRRWFNAPIYALTLMRDFLPWSALLALNARRLRDQWRATTSADRAVVGWAAAWTGALWLAFSVANLVRLRYLFPAYPVACGAAAGWLLRLARDPAEAARWGRWQRALLAAAAATALGLAATAVWLGPRALWAGVLLAAVAALAHRASRGDWTPAHAATFAAVAVVTHSLLVVIVQPVWNPSPSPEVARWLADFAVTGGRAAMIGSAVKIAAPVRLLTRGQLAIVEMPDSPKSVGRVQMAAVVPESLAAPWRESGHAMVPCGRLPPRSFGAFLRALRRCRSAPAAVEAAGEALWLALPAPSRQRSSTSDRGRPETPPVPPGPARSADATARAGPPADSAAAAAARAKP